MNIDRLSDPLIYWKLILHLTYDWHFKCGHSLTFCSKLTLIRLLIEFVEINQINEIIWICGFLNYLSLKMRSIHFSWLLFCNFAWNNKNKSDIVFCWGKNFRSNMTKLSQLSASIAREKYFMLFHDYDTLLIRINFLW